MSMGKEKKKNQTTKHNVQHETTETISAQPHGKEEQQMEKHCATTSPSETVAQFGASVAGSDILLPTAFSPCLSFLGSLV